MKYAIGVDIGGTNTRVALVDENYHIVERFQFPTDNKNPRPTMKKIKEIVDGFEFEIVGCGLSCPGPLDLINGIVLTTPNLEKGWWNFPISKELSELLGFEVQLENDANLAALAEAVLGQGKDKDEVVFMTISTGVGSGYVYHGKIFRGSHGFAHEVANIPYWVNGPSHGTIYPGGIEAISSGTAITLRGKKAGLSVEHAGEVNDLALSGNETAQTIMDQAKEYLANHIAAVYAFLDPEIVILGGSVALKINGFVEDVEQRVKEKVYSVVSPLVNIVKTDLDEDSGLLGAACLGFQIQK